MISDSQWRAADCHRGRHSELKTDATLAATPATPKNFRRESMRSSPFFGIRTDDQEHHTGHRFSSPALATKSYPRFRLPSWIFKDFRSGVALTCAAQSAEAGEDACG